MTAGQTSAGTARLSFAIAGDGQLVHVDDVPNGLSCQCVCPFCREPLIARQGNETTHHFAHVGNSDCITGAETSLHLAAKSILQRERRMILPPVVAEGFAVDAAGISRSAVKSIPEKMIAFDEIETEVRQNGFVPDIVAKVGGKQLLIEVAVTHFADGTKIDLLRDRGLATIEIDLKSHLGGWNWQSLTERVINGIDGKVWLFNPRHAELLAAAQEEVLRQVAIANKNAAGSATAIRNSHALDRKNIPGFPKALKDLADFTEPAKLAALKAQMAVAGQNESAWHSSSRVLNIDWGQAPACVNVEVKGEMGFHVDRRVWQSTIFSLFIRQNSNRTFSGNMVAKRCLNLFERRKEFGVLQAHKHLLTTEENQAIPWASRAVIEYLHKLEKMGFLKGVGGRYEILKRSFRT